MKFKSTIFIGILICAQFLANAQTNALVERVRLKLNTVNDYTAEGVMKTDVSFIKASLGKVKVYYKKPNLIKVKKDGGISLLPKGGVSITMNSLLSTDQYIAIEAGKQLYKGKTLDVIKLVPTDDKLDWVISTLWIDPVEALVYKTFTTTKDNGSFEIAMDYGAYTSYGLPSKIVFGFNTKDYKLPNGITLEFGDEAPISKQKAMKNKKGTIEIAYSSYIINKGVSSSLF